MYLVYALKNPYYYHWKTPTGQGTESHIKVFYTIFFRHFTPYFSFSWSRTNPNSQSRPHPSSRFMAKNISIWKISFRITRSSGAVSSPLGYGPVLGRKGAHLKGNYRHTCWLSLPSPLTQIMLDILVHTPPWAIILDQQEIFL